MNTFSPEDAAAAYERYAVPETGHIFYEAGLANFHLHPPTEVHFKEGSRAPLLIVGADKDHTVPASLAHKQFKKYDHGPAATDYLEFEGRPQLLMAAEGWEEVAESTTGGSTASSTRLRLQPERLRPNAPDGPGAAAEGRPAPRRAACPVRGESWPALVDPRPGV